MTMEIHFEKNKITINGNTDILTSENVSQLQYDNKYIFVLLDIPYKKDLSYDDYHNVYGYSNDGKLLWQIKKRPKSDDSVYTMIRVIEGKLYANDFLGRRYEVDKANGEIIGKVIITK